MLNNLEAITSFLSYLLLFWVLLDRINLSDFCFIVIWISLSYLLSIGVCFLQRGDSSECGLAFGINLKNLLGLTKYLLLRHFSRYGLVILQSHQRIYIGWIILFWVNRIYSIWLHQVLLSEITIIHLWTCLMLLISLSSLLMYAT